MKETFFAHILFATSVPREAPVCGRELHLFDACSMDISIKNKIEEDKI